MNVGSSRTADGDISARGGKMAERNLWVPLGVVGLLVVVPGSIYLYGMVLPSAYSSTASTVISAPPSDVWATMVDWESQESWRKDIEAFELVSDVDPVTFELEFKGGQVLRYVQSDVVANEHLVWTGLGVHDPTLDARWTVDLVAEGDGTRVTVTETGDIEGPVARVINYNLVGMYLMPRLYLIDLAAHHGGRAVFEEG
jgi:carbon monoxide dehydrogenase subunit G